MSDDNTPRKSRITREEALAYHLEPRPGKYDIVASTPMATQRDLSLAYSPGVAVPVEAIAERPETAYDYTVKGNMVAVISNGTAILGLGNLGALASKPVMEGKAVLFKRFADVNAIDIELDTEDPDAIVDAVRLMGPTFGGINLEDIKAPECFIIEQRLKELMDIPVFHDDQHGTAVICAAGLINALELSGKKIEDVRIVLNGAGAAGIACLELLKSMGARHENCIMCDTKGVIYQGRTEGMNQWKSAHAVVTEARTLEEAMKGADVFLGVSAKGAVTQDMVQGMAENPVIFAMANPDPEITPEEAHAVRPDAIVATGRSDYPNQVNNVLGFPYLFRGALDIHARAINDEMKIACARALAELAREDVPDEVAVAYGRKLQFGRDYIIPTPFDPRLIHVVPPAVAQAGMETGVARRPIIDMEGYVQSLKARMDPTAAILQGIHARARQAQARMIFAEGDDPRVLRAAVAWQRGGMGQSIVVGRESDVKDKLEAAGLGDAAREITVVNAGNSRHLDQYHEALYTRLQRKGYDREDAVKLANRDRHVFASLMLAHGHGDGLVTGATRKNAHVLAQIGMVFDVTPADGAVGITAVLHNGRVVLMGDTLVHEWPEAEDLADIATRGAHVARGLGLEPRVAFLSFSNFGYPISERAVKMAHATEVLDTRKVDFEYEGEMTVDVALNPSQAAKYPFSRLKEPANVLVVPARHSASISVKLLQEMAGATVIGPILTGVPLPIQICSTGSTVNDILNMAAIAAGRLGQVK
ncbi:NADP-dependent malic enzyme [Paracoccus denitrificans]|jgi:malate dehydrogenase (oxaloacetate-decarboxylating)(NADP+)|uniref:Malate dehydrogenase (Oxaloacetate-decarboxylating) (NADP(+)), Phosphate acetyltransferase n=1 Tax=Paracoccus denitrificans (strain Pd 1222) TaxID=318586 RepID=A1B0B6_PARDP|nr:NADP-dependent malic enzyme [Paracoccus denitrificans]ABL68960.1 Malate dehydrogenase (oxaloacetate-decarboxylating) (NADP(+)), Phosphate acetyltransferase [Paracoccus denitrificans PD1222]MBB4625314.1 malate dehydrogenase (oxaloacetate-decarboxylating)(NADP+) [Paracoccus denitrificans]MCU7428140.1 NADP-dependent malic enzyme [Paracoccus denitrificans]QAR27001.1 NADP-dependent malic enzyme [Paracoccus denitrificans]UPV95963.1 NADP-dependent malic enzyme [Paracoccus denitrificans]